VVGSCECGNELPSSVKYGECSLFPCWSGLTSTLYLRIYAPYMYVCMLFSCISAGRSIVNSTPTTTTKVNNLIYCLLITCYHRITPDPD